MNDCASSAPWSRIVAAWLVGMGWVACRRTKRWATLLEATRVLRESVERAVLN